MDIKIRLTQELIKESNEDIQQVQKFQIQSSNIDEGQHLLNYQMKDKKLKNSYVETKFQYQLLKSQKYDYPCYAFAFNNELNMLFVGCGRAIIVQYNGQISKMLQKLTYHVGCVNCLYLMKQTYSLVCGNDDSSISIWELDQNSQWTVSTILNDHEDYILCILMNRNEDLLISGSCDNTVKFWKKINKGWTLQQSIDLNDYSSSISLNENEDKLISCGDQACIQVMQMKQDTTWSVVQTINVMEEGYRILFLNNDQLIFQPRTLGFIELYNYDKELKKFVKHRQIQVQTCAICDWLFPIQFKKELNLLAVKHGLFLNLFKVQFDGDLNLIKTFEFNCEASYGILSEDGQYLVTWDQQSKQIQIRKIRQY